MIIFEKSTMATCEGPDTPCILVCDKTGWWKGHIFAANHSRDEVVQFDVEDCAGYFTIEDLEQIVAKMKELPDADDAAGS